MNATCVETERVSFDEASRILNKAIESLDTETVPLQEALGRVAAENIIAREDLVPYARSAMDGYAVRAEDTLHASTILPIALPIAERAFAGDAQASLTRATAIRITTGAPIPVNSDAVIPQERVAFRNGMIFVDHPVPTGDCIFPPAEDVRSGEVLLKRGSLVTPGTMGLLAFTGQARLILYRRPRVSLLCTGSELVEVSEEPRCGQVRNSNAFTLSALLTECGAETRYCGTVIDDGDDLRSALESALEGSDLLITTGGASVGERDFVKAVLEEMGAEFEFRRAAIRPGKPFAFARWHGVPVCVLPGNPAAAFVCYQEFVRPALLRMAGREKVELPVVNATLRGRAKSKAGSRYILFAKLSTTRSGFVVEPLPNQCSALVRNPAIANALILLPEGPATFATGATVAAHVLSWETVVEANCVAVG